MEVIFTYVSYIATIGAAASVVVATCRFVRKTLKRLRGKKGELYMPPQHKLTREERKAIDRLEKEILEEIKNETDS